MLLQSGGLDALELPRDAGGGRIPLGCGVMAHPIVHDSRARPPRKTKSYYHPSVGPLCRGVRVGARSAYVRPCRRAGDIIGDFRGWRLWARTETSRRCPKLCGQPRWRCPHCRQSSSPYRSRPQKSGSRCQTLSRRLVRGCSDEQGRRDSTVLVEILPGTYDSFQDIVPVRGCGYWELRKPDARRNRAGNRSCQNRRNTGICCDVEGEGSVTPVE